MKTIHKYALQPTGNSDYYQVPMPAGAQVLSVQMQRGVMCAWALVDVPEPKLPGAPIPLRPELHVKTFCFVYTGSEVPPGLTYVGTVQVNNDYLVLHVFTQP